MNLSTVVNLAQTLLPANSPWREWIPKAAEMAKGFQPNKDGVAKLMQAYGKRNSDLLEAAKMLDNPIIKNTLGRVPGLDSMLRNAASNLTNDPQFGQSQSPDMFNNPVNNPVQNTPPASGSILADRLSRLP